MTSSDTHYDVLAKMERELNDLALRVRCRPCGSDLAEPCITSGGKTRAPHRRRIDAAKAKFWVDALVILQAHWDGDYDNPSSWVSLWDDEKVGEALIKLLARVGERSVQGQELRQAILDYWGIKEEYGDD